jgi:putative tryptophan/tyrosine transport system substrate-binding protein
MKHTDILKLSTRRLRRKELMQRLLAVTALAVIAMTLPGFAQDGMRTIGILALGNPNPAAFISDFRGQLAELGYVEGKNVRLEIRSAEGQAARLEPLARELVHMKIDVLVPYQTPAVAAAKAVTRDIPIVMGAVGDPVGSGFVNSLSNPGGNITGVSGVSAELTGKNVEIIREVIPSVRRVAFLANQPDPFHATLIESFERAAAQLNIETKIVLARAGDDFDAHFSTIKDWGGEAVLVQPSLPLKQVVDSATKSRMPAFSPNTAFTQAGGLMAYSSDFASVHRQAATIVDKVLKGHKPAELPVETPTKFRLIVNARAASAIGLTLPPLLLTRADELIE